MINDTLKFWTTRLPHDNCYHSNSDLLWLNVLSDAFIGFAYITISICFYLYMRRREATQYRPVLIMFAAFIFTCGLTHSIAVWNVWQADHFTHGISKSITAMISMATAVMLIPIFPKLATLKSPIQLEALNTELSAEIEAQQKITNKLRRTEKQFRAFLQHAPDGIFICTKRGQIEYSNNMLQKMFDYSPEELIGENIVKFIPHRSRDRISLEHNHLFDEQAAWSALEGAEVMGMRRDKSEFPVEIRMNSIFSEGEEVILVTLRDIGERKIREEDARKELMEIAHESRMSTVGHMATGLAHELNQPLTEITTNLHTAKLIYGESENANPELIEIMNENYTAAQRAGQIIRGLRQLVRKNNTVKNEVDINALVKATAALIEPEARSAGVEVLLNLDSQLQFATVDPVQIQQVIVNLGRNAIEAFSSAHQDNAKIVITTRQQGLDNMLITVKDNGAGVDEDVLVNLFQPHFTSKETGMGLGLSISLSIIESINGELWHESQEDSGAAFFFTIPTDVNGAA